MLALRIVFAGIVDTEDLPLDSEATPILLVTRLSGRACGDRIRILRKRLGLTRQAVATFASISYYAVSQAEIEPEKVALRKLTAICNALCHHLAISFGYGALDVTTLNALRQLVPGIFAAEGVAMPTGHSRIDLIIVTALTEEAQVVAATLDHLASFVGTDGPVRRYAYRTGSGETFNIAAASAHTMGAVGMGVFTGPLLRDLRPNSAVLVGIAAAVDTSEIALGDVPISSQVLSYDDIAVEDGTLTFRSEGFQVDPAMILGVGKLRTSTETYLPWQRCCQATIRQVISDVNQLRRKPIILPETQDPPHLVVGVTAGGPILLRDQDFRDSLRKPQTLPNHAVVKLTSPLHPKLISVEMESHGFMRAAHQYSVPASVVKGISDIGDARKTAVEKRTGGFFRAYACCNAVIATLHAIDFRRRSLLPT